MTDAERYAKLRAAVDVALARLLDMKTLGADDLLVSEVDSLKHTLVLAQTIAGDAWRILDAACAVLGEEAMPMPPRVPNPGFTPDSRYLGE